MGCVSHGDDSVGDLIILEIPGKLFSISRGRLILLCFFSQLLFRCYIFTDAYLVHHAIMYKNISFLHFFLFLCNIFLKTAPLTPRLPPFSCWLLLPCDSDGDARARSTCLSWSFLEMQSLRLTQTSWLSFVSEHDLHLSLPWAVFDEW